MCTAQLGLAENSGLGFCESAKVGCAAMDDFAWYLRFEGSGFRTRTRGIRKNVKIGEWKRINEVECGLMVGFCFAGKSGDDVSTDCGVWQKFSNELYAPGVVLGAIPAVHRSED